MAPLRLLAILWTLVFGTGALVTLAAAWREPFSLWRDAQPMLWSVPAGQLVLLIASASIVRDPRRSTGGVAVLCVYKLVAGLGMSTGLLLPGGTGGAGLLVAAGGGFLDLGMGALTWALWHRAHRGPPGSDSADGSPMARAPYWIAAAPLAILAAWFWIRLAAGEPSSPLARVAAANLAGSCGGVSAALAVGWRR